MVRLEKHIRKLLHMNSEKETCGMGRNSIAEVARAGQYQLPHRLQLMFVDKYNKLKQLNS
jgi:hypothetical protein